MPGNSTNLLLRIRLCLGVFILVLLAGGAACFPLLSEAQFLYRAAHARGIFGPAIREWAQAVYAALLETNARYPFLFYGTDWVAFGHFALAIAFIGPMRDPVRNVWMAQFGAVLCLLAIPWALGFGHLRGIPPWARAVTCVGGLGGFLLFWHVLRCIRQLAPAAKPSA